MKARFALFLLFAILSLKLSVVFAQENIFTVWQPDYQKSPYCIIKALYNAAKGNMKRGYAFAGSNAFLSDKIRSVKEVISTLNTEFLLATCQLVPAKMKT